MQVDAGPENRLIDGWFVEPLLKGTAPVPITRCVCLISYCNHIIITTADALDSTGGLPTAALHT